MTEYEKKTLVVTGEEIISSGIEWADSARVDMNRPSTNKLLLLIGEYMGWGGDISRVFVTDESSISDFGLKDDEISEISNKLGITLSGREYIADIVEKMDGAI